MTPEIVPRWEWRTFGDGFGPAEEALAALEPARVEETDELYLLAEGSDASVKVRDAQMDVKPSWTSAAMDSSMRRPDEGHVPAGRPDVGAVSTR